MVFPADPPVRRVRHASRSIAMPLFLINLDVARERRRHMLAQLRAHRLLAHRIGIDCRLLTRQQIAANAARRFPDIRFTFEWLSGAEVGCWMSHLSAWTAFLSGSSGDACAVIEDDVVLEPEFTRALSALAGQQAYDVVYLGTSSRSLFARRGTSIEGIRVCEPRGPIFNTWGYVIRRQYLERLFAVRPRRISAPVDHLLGGRLAETRPTLAVVQPVVVREEETLGRASQIEPYTWRIDRWRMVERARRALLGSRMSDWYYALLNAR